MMHSGHLTAQATQPSSRLASLAPEQGVAAASLLQVFVALAGSILPGQLHVAVVEMSSLAHHDFSQVA